MKKQFSKYFAPSLKDARKRIQLVKNVEFVIEDKYQGKITAYGRINHKLLFLLIDKIVSTKK